ncbi:MAG TPA: adenosylhomocysteinase [Magnetospirillaceae bacterium]|jgi:adenosylhomocysteinase
MSGDLLERGRRRVEWIRSQMHLLARVRKDFEASQPFKGLTIGMGLHTEPKTVVLIETLRAGGARIVGTGNHGSTQDDMVAVLRATGMEIYGNRTDTWEQHLADVARVVDSKPDILLDNGADLVATALAKGTLGSIRGGTEETTSGDDRLRSELAGKVPFPVIVINDSPIKQIVENQHAVGEGVVESFMRMTNLQVNGRRFVVVGYGWCGRGTAHYLRSFGGQVAVAEIDPIKQMEAVMAGFKVGTLKELAPWGQAFVTVTAREKVISTEAFNLMPNGAVLANSGHFPTEIDVPALRQLAKSTYLIDDDIERFDLPNGNALFLIANGRMFNLAGREPKGNSIEAMDVGFLLQSLCLERVAQAKKGDLALGANAVPKDINREIASRIVTLLS